MNRESFLIYTSFYKPISTLSDKQLGRLFRAIFRYNLGEAVNVEEDIRMAFEFFKNQFEIDENKYQAKIKRDIDNGRRGGNPNIINGKSKGLNREIKDNPRLTPDNPRLTPDNPRLTPVNPINDNVNVNDNNISSPDGSDIASYRRARTHEEAEEEKQNPDNPGNHPVGQDPFGASAGNQYPRYTEICGRIAIERGVNAAGNRILFFPPSQSDLITYCNQRSYTFDVSKFLDKYAATLWRDGQGLPINNWRTLADKWQRMQDLNAPERQENEPSDFTPPSVEEVRLFILEKNYHFSAEEFVAFYESNGWKVGPNPMKRWKAACYTWERHKLQEQNRNNHGNNRTEQRTEQLARELAAICAGKQDPADQNPPVF